jgi:hypothetical protein
MLQSKEAKMYQAIIIPRPSPINSSALTTAINNAVPPGSEIVSVAVDGAYLIIVYK